MAVPSPHISFILQHLPPVARFPSARVSYLPPIRQIRSEVLGGSILATVGHRPAAQPKDTSVPLKNQRPFKFLPPIPPSLLAPPPPPEAANWHFSIFDTTTGLTGFASLMRVSSLGSLLITTLSVGGCGRCQMCFFFYFPPFLRFFFSRQLGNFPLCLLTRPRWFLPASVST